MTLEERETGKENKEDIKKEKYIQDIKSLGFGDSLIQSFSKEWDSLVCEGYEMYALYKTQPTGGEESSDLPQRSSCTICSAATQDIRWEKVITPSTDCAVIFSVCDSCDAQYIQAAIRQKALGRLLKERNTRPA